ncbi:putative serine/threonine-protein kinase WNK11 [Histomonas meleagridis]|uniref:putative serine/threonine-protein kinase WNK11 n=1 Tax=Histomonas meleagridis TaxID=135588 RepID=UPI0035598914|nr:putative serine/threonine-protein kinase WNK11 [Histomonas meleagridis]KAH0804225.1 putative serine/threonine-protein kinase WNK11 [Histomonas meleagridis]
MSKPGKSPVLDPTGQYQRFDEIINTGTSIVQFKGYANRIGIEVTWHEIDINHLNSNQVKYLLSYSETLKSLKCESLMSFLHCWVNEEKHVLCFITESLSSSSILEQVEHQATGPKALRKWFYAVLQALDYLHSRPTPIVHNHITLPSIFLKASTGHIKLIPPLVDPLVLKSAPNSLKLQNITPPEALFQNLCPASDIWQFGIALLSAATQTDPYSECKTPLELVHKLQNFQPPDCVNMVTDPTLASLIRSCLTPTSQRPNARTLLSHPFFTNFNQKETKQETNIGLNNDIFQVIYSGTPNSSTTDLLAQEQTNKGSNL